MKAAVSLLTLARRPFDTAGSKDGDGGKNSAIVTLPPPDEVHLADRGIGALLAPL